ncbi:MAG: protease modulator HflC [Devosia sp.]|nr:protease modulator HflC [Devosia sp.]
MNRLIALGVVLVAALYLLFSSLYVVNPRQQAIVTRFGQITDVKTAPGLYFKIPTSLVDNVQIVENRLLRYDIANMTLQVKDGKFYIVDAFVTYRVVDPRKFRERALGNLDLVESRLHARFDAALRQVYGLREFQAALSAQRGEMMTQARDLIRPDMAELGIDVVDVRILRTDLTDQVSAQTYDRMKAERLAQAALLRANGQQAAQSIRAIANRQGIEIVADATRDSEILRGQGDAERSQIYAQAYNADPDFFAFYRSMQAYRTGLSGTGTTMVLSPESEFFKFFGDSGKAVVPPAAAAALSATPALPTVAPVPDVIPPADSNLLSGTTDSGAGPTAGPSVAAPSSAAPVLAVPDTTTPASPATGQ